MSDRPPDPMGKRALYWLPAPPDDGRPAPLGKRALFSAAAETGRGPLRIVCGRCRVPTRMGVLDYLRRRLPLALWRPGYSFDRLMRCPSCGQRAWMSVTLRH
jgi:hypothetical protein